jgi:hypothetical protein
MIKNPFSKAAIASSLLYIVIAIKINYDIALQYARSDGKTKAIYGLIELSYLYQYYFLFLIVMSIIFTWMSFKKRENKGMVYISIGLILFSVILTLIKPWTYMT